MQRARPRPRDAPDLGPTRVGHRGGGRGPRPSRPARRRSTSSGCDWPAASRYLLEQVHLPAERFPGLLASDLEHGSLYELLATRYGDAASSAPARPSSPSCCGPARRACWTSAAATPALLIEGIAFAADDTPVEFGRTFVRGDRSRYYVERDGRPADPVATAVEAVAQAGGASGDIVEPPIERSSQTEEYAACERTLGRFGRPASRAGAAGRVPAGRRHRARRRSSAPARRRIGRRRVARRVGVGRAAVADAAARHRLAGQAGRRR